MNLLKIDNKKLKNQACVEKSVENFHVEVKY